VGDDEWAKKKAKEIKDRQEANARQRQLSADEDKRKRSEAPALWEELKRNILETHKQLMVALGDLNALQLLTEGSSMEIKTPDDAYQVSISFVPELLAVRLILVGTSAEYKIEIGPKGDVVWKSREGSYASATTIAKRLFDSMSTVM
jgi:hypothetical protein